MITEYHILQQRLLAEWANVRQAAEKARQLMQPEALTISMQQPLVCMASTAVQSAYLNGLQGR